MASLLLFLLTSEVLLISCFFIEERHFFLTNPFSVIGYHPLYDWYRSMESEHFPDPTGLRTRLEQWTLGLYPACIKYLMSAFDVPEVIRLFLETFLLFQYKWICTCTSIHFSNFVYEVPMNYHLTSQNQNFLFCPLYVDLPYQTKFNI